MEVEMPFQLNSNPSFPKVLSSLRPVNHTLLWLLKVCRHIRATSGQVRCVLIVENRKAEGSSISWLTKEQHCCFHVESGTFI